MKDWKDGLKLTFLFVGLGKWHMLFFGLKQSLESEFQGLECASGSPTAMTQRNSFLPVSLHELEHCN